MGDTSFPEELVQVKIPLSFLVGYTATEAFTTHYLMRSMINVWDPEVIENFLL